MTVRAARVRGTIAAASSQQTGSVRLAAGHEVDAPDHEPGADAGGRFAHNFGDLAPPRVSNRGDPSERAADRVADALVSDGRPLPLGGVRVHADAAAAVDARALRARAFTYGRDIYFGLGAYQPHTPAGRWLLAHELAHTQQPMGDVIARYAIDAPLPESAYVERDTGLDEPVVTELIAALRADPADVSGGASRILGRLSPERRNAILVDLSARQPSQPPMARSRDSKTNERGSSSDSIGPNRVADASPTSRGRPPGTSRAAGPEQAAVMSRSLESTPLRPASNPSPAIAQGATDGRRVGRQNQPSSPSQAAVEGVAQPAVNEGLTTGDDSGSGPLRLAALFDLPSPPAPESIALSGGLTEGIDEADASAPLASVAPFESTDSTRAVDAETRPLALQTETYTREATNVPGAGGVSEVPEEAGGASAEEPRATGGEVEAMASSLEQALPNARASMEALALTTSQGVRSRAAAARAGIGADVERTASGVTADTNALRARFAVSVAAAHTQINIGLASRMAEVSQAGEDSRANLREIFATHRAEIERSVSDSIVEAEQLRTDYATRAQERNREDKRRATQLGRTAAGRFPRTERGWHQSSAAYGVADETVRKMDEQEPEIIAAIEEITAPLPETFETLGDSALERFDAGLPELEAGVASQVTAAHVALRAQATRAHQGIDVFADQVLRNIAGIEQRWIGHVRTVAPQIEAQLTQSVAAAVRQIRSVPSTVMERVAPPIEEAAELLREAPEPDVDAARAMTDALLGFLEASTEQSGTSSEEAADAAGERAESTRVRVGHAASQSRRSSTQQLGEIETVTSQRLTAVVAQTDATHAMSIGTFRAGFADVEAQVRTRLAPAINRLRDRSGATLRDARAKVAQAFDEGFANNTEALGILPEKMEEAADDAAWDYDHPVLSGLRDVGMFIAGALIAIVLVLVVVVVAIVAFKLLVAGLIALGVSAATAAIIAAVVGVGLLALGVYQAYSARAARGESGLEALGGAVLDLTGITALRRGFTEPGLTPFERGWQIGEGAATLATFFLGRRINKGVDGAFARVPRLNAIVNPRQGAAVDWFRARLGRSRPDVGLANRGFRPPPGSRTTTRAEYRAQSRAERVAQRPGLENRGYRPQPGERLTTRAQYEAQSRATRVRAGAEVGRRPPLRALPTARPATARPAPVPSEPLPQPRPAAPEAPTRATPPSDRSRLRVVERPAESAANPRPRPARTSRPSGREAESLGSRPPVEPVPPEALPQRAARAAGAEGYEPMIGEPLSRAQPAQSGIAGESGGGQPGGRSSIEPRASANPPGTRGPRPARGASPGQSGRATSAGGPTPTSPRPRPSPSRSNPSRTETPSRAGETASEQRSSQRSGGRSEGETGRPGPRRRGSTGERKPTRAEKRRHAARDAETERIQREIQGVEPQPRRSPTLAEALEGEGEFSSTQVQRGGRRVPEDLVIAEAAGSEIEGPLVREFASRQPPSAQTFGSKLGRGAWARLRGRFPEIARLFGGNSRPDAIAIDAQSRTITLFDATSRTNAEHLAKSSSYLDRLLTDPVIQSRYRGWRVSIREQYWESGFLRSGPTRTRVVSGPPGSSTPPTTTSR
jgi:hypothetical protein